MATRQEHIVLKLLSNRLDVVHFADSVSLLDHAQSRRFEGQWAVANLFHTIFNVAFPGAQIKIGTFVADKQAAAVEFELQGSHQGVFMGVPPSGREITLPMTLICQLKNDLIHSANLYYDAGAFLRQVGLAN